MRAEALHQRPKPIESLIRRKAAHPTAVASDLRATVVLDLLDDGCFTLRISGGLIEVIPVAAKHWDTKIETDSATLTAVLSGKVSGAEAYLQSKIRVRGNLALALKVEWIFEARKPNEHPRPASVLAGGIDTFYLEAGKGTPVILLHGLGATNASFLPTMVDLAKHYRVIAPDLPGFGESGKPVRAYDARFFARWLSDFMDELGIESAHLVGNSMGGRIALEMAMEFPDRVDRMVLLTPSMAFIRGRQFVPLVMLLRSELAAIPILLSRRQALAGVRSMFARPSRLPDCWYDSAIDEFFRVFTTPRGRMALFSAARQIYLEPPHGRRGFWERIRKVDSPALFVWGDTDRLVPARFARHVTSALPGAKSVVLKDCGHVPQFELPAKTNKLVREFLAG
ncbi:MAG TPA: alpha/beta fold hydrolase [Actinomycetota bacterium]|nr:alpha/beta fold hydrolase [Actinomycetota bacterium]